MSGNFLGKPNPQQRLIGTVLRNRYKLLKTLGSGGFGDTYLATDQDLPTHPHCVVKHLKPKDSNPEILVDARRLFETEAKILHRLGNAHDRIPKLFAFFEENGEFYLVQEYIDGQDLGKELLPGKRLSESEVTRLLEDILSVLKVAHENNVIHRDIKPANLMRRKDGRIVLIDFGAVKQINQLATSANGQTSLTVAIGSPGYMPSEQGIGKPKLASDIYAVGMLGIQALTGIYPKLLPEDSQTGEIVWRNQAQVSHNLARFLEKMVRYDFRQRYLNAAEALKAFLETVVGSSPAPSASSHTVQPPPTPVNLSPLPPTEPFFVEPVQPPVAPILPKTQRLAKFTVVTVDKQGKVTNRSQAQLPMATEDLGNGITLTMVAIPGGRFLMGSPETEAERDSDENPQHWVTVPAFYMGQYAVTQAQYQAVMGNNPSRFQGSDRPVERVSWNDAVEFCHKLSQRTGQRYRLPSEAEWEYACRAGTTTPFHFGETITPDLVNYDGNYSYDKAPIGKYRQETTPVGHFGVANAFGLYDMHGNVWEWCQDVWHKNYHGAPTDGRAWESGGDLSSRLLRGGSWGYFARSCRSASRYRGASGFRYNGIGFRVVRA
ncbi:SUMF1/EgtB/PvdO family nonheme iron enzyme [Desertifilum sp. FACHB-1129]|uniref:Protein kinase n=1 Tax=Desertifilum tharense IPPAS B-1220 TaxID=1781255 RepID=A0A1E5QCN6_9CYAN|nr:MULTISPECIES: bifunctional serine/threonine-protein kinase/formylglycine-generating enzyme family protein [Desertifilum]MDA0210845.1 bifunctional serine/threonine-protein kinase/formylglycine-generating enzyme family protein [Cyanobacteria bacterium FC1]MBD2312078.1 SUMF1/EgtB/PvdO family nonheme iron enzyme [Desertifilum sp. FACHB-1129]MBD2322261.1 SUMF1/EgtB/PvdO family nonheme iron enzyme [Desertifilum sp. FACHB-866]MBD2332298.1 SUMF1/EgtB/PvdO family nonheme iron enzyme [Desertifilum sp.